MGGTGRGGAIRLVPGHPRLGGDGDMESGAYGAANAGGSFDLRRFVSQPQVVTRLVSMVSRPERTRSRASGYQGPWAAGRGARQVAAAARPGPGGERRAPRPSGSLFPPARASRRLFHCVAPDLVSPTRGRAPPHRQPLVLAALVRDVPEVLRGGRPVALLAVGGAGEGHATAGGQHAAAPNLGNSPGRDFLKPRGVQGGGLARRPEGGFPSLSEASNRSAHPPECTPSLEAGRALLYQACRVAFHILG